MFCLCLDFWICVLCWLVVCTELIISCFILKFLLSCFTSCLLPVSCPCDRLHLFLMCFTCVQLSLPPPLCIKSLCFPLSLSLFIAYMFSLCCSSVVYSCIYSPHAYLLFVCHWSLVMFCFELSSSLMSAFGSF